MTELTRGDLVVAPDKRCGIILASRSDDRTVVGFDDGSSEQISRSDLRLANKTECSERARKALEAAHTEALTSRARMPELSGAVIVPGGRVATVVVSAGRTGVVVEYEDGERDQFYRGALKAAESRSSDR